MGDNNTGLKLAQRAVQLDNTNPKSRFWHARLLELNKNTLQAQAEYQWLANHYPEESDYQEALANILRQQGQLEQAEAIYARLPQDREIERAARRFGPDPGKTGQTMVFARRSGLAAGSGPGRPEGL